MFEVLKLGQILIKNGANLSLWEIPATVSKKYLFLSAEVTVAFESL